MNRATLSIVQTIGVLLALSGMNHGLFEILQGNDPTNGFFIAAIGEEHRMWVHGEEGAFTLIPNYLASGIATWVVALAIIVWSLRFLQTRHGALIFLLLFVLLFLVGGGVAQVLFFTVAYAAATRIDKPLTLWRSILTPGFRRVVAPLWKGLLVLTAVIGLVDLWLATTGYIPGLPDDDRVLGVMVVLLLVWYVIFLFTFVAGFAYDIDGGGAQAVREPEG